MENSIEVPQKIKKRTTIWHSNHPAGYIFKGIENKISKRYSCIHIHYSTIHNGQDVAGTLMSIDGWMGKENVVYT